MLAAAPLPSLNKLFGEVKNDHLEYSREASFVVDCTIAYDDICDKIIVQYSVMQYRPTIIVHRSRQASSTCVK